MVMVVMVMVVIVHLLVHIFHIASTSIIRLVMGVVDDVVFCQVMKDWSVLFLIGLLMTNLIHLGRCGEMFDCNPDVGPLVL